MRVKGNVLLILLIMLLFASVALLQLNQDNYLAHLMNVHVENLASARKVLKEGFEKLSVSSVNPVCYSDVTICQIKISGMIVNYALHQYQQEDQKNSYLQYRLETKTGDAFIQLKVVVDQISGRQISWNYYD